MTQTQPLYDAEGNEVTLPEETPAIAAAREAADRNAARADGLERELALTKALPTGATETALGKMFADSYKGEMTNEAIQAAAAEVGLVQPVVETPPTELEDAAAQAARAGLQSGAVPPTEPLDPELAEDPTEFGLQKFHEAMRNGATAENASAHYFDRIAGAANRGDERVLWKGWSEEQLAGA